MNIVLTTDHAGLEQIKKIETFLTEAGHTCINMAPTVFDANDDYPDLIYPAAKALADGKAEMGIIMGGSGQGEAMVANRVAGVRAAVYYGPAQATGAVDANGSAPEDEYEIVRLSRQHNNANMLSLAARFLTDEEIEKAVTLWLATPFTGEARHERRINKIDSQGKENKGGSCLSYRNRR